jgi:hypothetical protein
MRLPTVILGALLLTPGLAAADLSGIWMGQVPGRRGASTDISFQLAQEGDKLGGKLYEDMGSTPLVEGGIEGDQFFFVVVAREQAGNQVNLVAYRYEGKVVDGELELTRERTKAVDAVSGAEYPVNERRPNDENREPPKIRLKRLL